MPEQRLSFFTEPKLFFAFPEFFNDISDCEPRIQGFLRPTYVRESLQKTLEKLQLEHPEIIELIRTILLGIGADMKRAVTDEEKFNEIFGSSLSDIAEQREKLQRDYQVDSETLESLSFSKESTIEIIQDISKSIDPNFFSLESIKTFYEEAPAIAEKTVPAFEVSQKENKAEILDKINSKIKRKSIGVLCLTEDHMSKKMWGLYASEHTGFAVGIDTNNVLFHGVKDLDTPLEYLKKVSYKPENELSYFTDYYEDFFTKEGPKRSEFLHDLIFTKDDQWEFEKEWRMAINVQEHFEIKEKGILIPVPPSIVRGVYLGNRASEGLHEAAAEFCRTNMIPLYKIGYCDRKLELITLSLD